MIQKLFEPDQFRSARLAMVENQLRLRGIRDECVLGAMEEVPRHLFIPEPARNEAYEDRPVPIGEEQTISQPYIVAAMISYLQVTAESRVLEVGTGTGYQAAVLSRLVSEVFTIERHPSLAGKAREILKELNYANIQVNVGDGSLGLPAQGPYDRIIVAAAAPSVPAQLLEQLREGGRLVIPVGSADVQVLQLVRRQHGEVLTTNLEGCRFVPLLGQGGFQPRNF